MSIKIVAFRGEHGEPDGKPFHTRQGAVSFGTVAAAKLYATSPNNRDDTVVSPRIIKAEITINNPVMNQPDDPFIDFSIIMDAIGVEKAKHIALEEEGHLCNTDNWYEVAGKHKCTSLKAMFEKIGVRETLAELYIDAYPIFDSPEYVGWFREAGFDGLVQCGNGETYDMPEYKIFNHDQAQVLKVLQLKARDKDLDVESELGI